MMPEPTSLACICCQKRIASLTKPKGRHIRISSWRGVCLVCRNWQRTNGMYEYQLVRDGLLLPVRKNPISNFE